MNYIAPDIPPMLDNFYIEFDNIFSERIQKENFRLYGTGLLLEIKRKNIQSVSDHIISSNYQSMHHFIHDSPWDEYELNNQRIEMLEKTRQTKSCSDGYLILDDTGKEKIWKLYICYKKTMDGLSW